MVDTVLAADTGGGGAHGGGGGGGGDLYADLYVLVRDLDPSDGGGNGEPVLDANGQVIPIGLDTATGATFPIYYTEIAEGDFEIPADQLPYVQEVVLERVNVIRAPDSVREHALEEALAKITAATSITTDFAGRIVVDGSTIDAPNENLALYHLIMTEGGVNSWTDVLANAGTNLPAQIADLLASGWDPSGLLGGAAGKSTPFTMDAVLTAHSISGVNEVTGSGDTLQINYFSFTDGTTETYDYDRVARYGDMWVQWYQDMNGDPSNLEAVRRTVLDAVWGSDGDGDGVNDVGSGADWKDEYIKLSVDGLSFETFAATGAGINDWSAAVDDSRAVINFMHEAVGGDTVTAPLSTDDTIIGFTSPDYLTAWGGDDVMYGLEGNDVLEAGDGDDTVLGGVGNDVLKGEAGSDMLLGGTGNDTVFGNADSDRLFGEAGDDSLVGGTDSAFDLLVGGDGKDTVDGASGNGEADYLYGGTGDDLFRVDAANDLVFEFAGEGTDSVVANISGTGYYLYAGIEALTLAGNTPFGVGNELANTMTGSATANWLLGGLGNDTINGKEGGDVLFGEGGSDTFVFERGTGGDVIGDFTAGVDKLDLSDIGFVNFAAVLTNFVVVGGDSAIDLGLGDFVVLNGITSLSEADVILV